MPTFQTSDDIELHYTDEGEGLPVLCLAGLTRNGSDFDYLAPHLDGVRLIRLDYRGRGKSSWADASTYQIPVEMRDAVELLDHLGLDRVGLIGTSRGGLIAMLMAAKHKDRLAGVCLVDIGPVLDQRGLSAIMGYVGQPPEAKTRAEAAAMRAQLMDGFEDVPEGRWEEEVAKHYVETDEGLAINYDPALRDAIVATGAEPQGDSWQLFEALEELPLALVRGENSDLLGIKTADEMGSRRPDMIRAEVPGRGHIPFLDEPEALDAIRAWLDRMR
jgi:pimeloyl-ACP methyl ester carboxylesterase